MTGTNNNFTTDSDVSKDSDISTNSMNRTQPDDPNMQPNMTDERLREEAAVAQKELDSLLEEISGHTETAEQIDQAVSKLEEGVNQLGEELANMDHEFTQEEVAAAAQADKVSEK